MGDGRRIERITMVYLLQRGMSMSRMNHVIRIVEDIGKGYPNQRI